MAEYRDGIKYETRLYSMMPRFRDGRTEFRIEDVEAAMRAEDRGPKGAQRLNDILDGKIHAK